MSFPLPVMISATDDLVAFCHRSVKEDFITIDTEFMREKTYYPQLCLIQIGTEQETVLIDALAPGLDLVPLKDLFTAPQVTKVFHAARQDLEIFWHKFRIFPEPFFDTQIAAMTVGLGDQISYENLVAALTPHRISKAQRFSDWSRRPLSEAQIAYAAADVTCLRQVYVKLSERVAKLGRSSWSDEEMQALTDRRLYEPNPESLWRRLHPKTRDRAFLGRLRAIALWREKEAGRLNIPRQYLLKDEQLPEIALQMPPTAEALMSIRGITARFAEGKAGQDLIKELAAASELPEKEWENFRKEAEKTKTPQALLALLRVLLAADAEKAGVSPGLIARTDELEAFLTGNGPEKIRFLNGWRFDVFGKNALALCEGKLGLAVINQKISRFVIPESPVKT